MGRMQREEKGDGSGDENHGKVDVNENGDLGTLGSDGLLDMQTRQWSLMPTAHTFYEQSCHGKGKELLGMG